MSVLTAARGRQCFASIVPKYVRESGSYRDVSHTEIMNLF